MYFKQVVGKYGESLARSYLINHNYTIITQNFYCYQGEIDIVARDLLTNELVFFEVKTRSNFKYGKPIDAVDNKKSKHLKKACEYFIYKYRLYDYFIRIDVIEVFMLNNTYKINHVKQIF